MQHVVSGRISAPGGPHPPPGAFLFWGQRSNVGASRELVEKMVDRFA